MKTLFALLILSFSLLAQFGCSWGWNGYVEVNVKIFLEGPFDTDTMRTDLSDYDYVPLEQPYDNLPWSYSGTEAVDEIPLEVVDWVLVELREESTKLTARKAGFILSNGNIVDLDGVNPVKVKASPGKYYVVIYHRNHLAAMTAGRIILKRHSILYDFTTDISKFYNSTGAKDLGEGDNIWSILAGDADSNGIIDSVDYDIWFANRFHEGYEMADFNLNGSVTVADNSLRVVNDGEETGVPSLGE